tara:strand:+ start:2732 stop:3007 length:276 start_codon:yes stop_codon:yes gene_type:complete
MGKTGLTDIYTAIDAYTLNAAKSLGIDDITDTIEVGKSADFAILNKDITTLSARGIAKTQVLMTVLRGDVVWCIRRTIKTNLILNLRNCFY